MNNKLAEITAMIALAALSMTGPAAAATHSRRMSDAPFLSTAGNYIAAFDVPSSTEQSVNAHRYHGGPKEND